MPMSPCPAPRGAWPRLGTDWVPIASISFASPTPGTNELSYPCTPSAYGRQQVAIAPISAWV